MSKRAFYLNTSRLTPRMLAAGMVSTAMMSPPAASAQDAAAGAETRDVIVVTAQQREQNLQEVPITLQVVTADDIAALAADNIGDIDVFVPGLQVSTSSPTQPRFEIRGIRTSDFGVGTDPAVGVYVDGVYAARSGASLLAFNDIERIEVLKGPQGTLFGRNSAAGAVSIITKKPSNEFELEAMARIGNFEKRRIEGLINIPVSDRFALRATGVFNTRDGLFTDADTGEDLSRQDNWAIRASARLDVTDNLQALLQYSHDELDQDARPAIGVVAIPPAPGRPPVPVDTAAFIDPFTAEVRNDVIGNSEARNLDEVTLTLTYDIGEIELTSISSYRAFETINLEDEDGTNRRDLYFDTANVEDNESFYQEVRAAGVSGDFNWLVGLSYYDETANQRSNTTAFTDSINTTLSSVGLGTPFTDIEGLIPPGAGLSVFGHLWREDFINRGEYQAFAAFADVIWAITDDLSFTAGARYTRDEKSFSWLNGPRVAPDLDATLAAIGAAGAFDFDIVFDLSAAAGLPCDNGVVVGEGVECILEDTFTDFSPRFVADYKITDDILVFASYAQGYKAGGFNSVEILSRFDNEDVRNYEAGVKSTFPGLDLLVNLSVFYYRYNDRQAIRLETPAGSSVPQYVVTTSDEEAFGVDIQTNWSPVEPVVVFANAQYIDATLADNITRSGLDLTGQPVGEPFWSLAVGGAFTHDLADHGDVSFQLTHAYEGETRCNDDSVAQGTCAGFPPVDVGEAQHRTDLRAYWQTEDERLQVGAFVNNVFDNRYVLGINNLTAATLGTPFVSLTEPRFWGFDVRIRY